MSVGEAEGPHPKRSGGGRALAVPSGSLSPADGVKGRRGSSTTGDGRARLLAFWVNNFASQDWLVIGYLVALLGALAVGRGHDRGGCAWHVLADLVSYVIVLALVRLPVLPWGSAASSLIYRLAVLGAVLASFFQLREILPAVSPWAEDARIYALDLRVFGFEPCLWMDRFVSRRTTEWFAFFYFFYFLILTVHILPMLLIERDTRLLGSFSVGALLVFLTAHLVYMAVPGWGPYWYLRASFGHPLVGGTFWRLVREAVEAGGAQKDIFPSLHTAAPTFLAIFSFGHRNRAPFKYTWGPMAFFATQIIIATMFLRWHYLLDVVAGVILAVAAFLFARRIAYWEHGKRERLGLQASWMPLVYPWERRHGA
ncbi:MAG TPA: phosphatase PAP2 family protein [Polyangiaceae bacterium]|nr:phosphatase PAP2 family protein [Polyangiaceae bacterium]